ncbi:MAG: ergothioneine biosynthesis protein EgtC [Acidimicrobiia bacterium]
MCRLAAYIGSQAVPLSALLYDPPHSLERASYAPRELLSGTVNVDGTGVAWWPEDRSEPLRYVTTKPPWSDPNLPDLAPALQGRTVLAAVRSATPGIPFGPSNVAPFVAGGLAGVHNGWIGGFRHGVGRELLSSLSDERFGQLAAMNDSLALFLLVAQQFDDEPGKSLGDAVTTVIQNAAKAVVAADRAATLNLVVASRSEIVAVRTSAGTDANSLYWLATDTGSLVASEPLDPDDEWTAVPKHSLVVLTKDRVDIRPIEHEGMS